MVRASRPDLAVKKAKETYPGANILVIDKKETGGAYA